MNKLRLSLLSNILGGRGVYENKYTLGYNSLKAVIELELKEKKDRLPKHIFDRFNNIQENLSNVNEKLVGVPIIILEQYFLRNTKSLNRYVYIMHEDIEIEIKVIEIYTILENWYFHLFLIASEIADYYNLEIKLKKEKDLNEDIRV